MDEKTLAAQAALHHIVDAASSLTREQAMTAATALQAGWMTDEERNALADLSAALDRLANAGATCLL